MRSFGQGAAFREAGILNHEEHEGHEEADLPAMAQGIL
jgi:hypothetical protein